MIGIKDIVFENITIDEAEKPLVINQCYSNVAQANCSTSTFEIGDVTYRDITGTVAGSTTRVAEFQCSRSQAGCDDLVFENVQFTNTESRETADGVKCSNVNDPEGFECDD